MSNWIKCFPHPIATAAVQALPVPGYWQQKADYVIDVELNDENQSLTGSETITYFNNAPEDLKYIWLQLDQNINADGSMTKKTSRGTIRDSIPAKTLATTVGSFDYKGGYTIKYVKDVADKDLPYIINNTMMRIDLPQPLKKGEKFSFKISWSYNINDMMMISGRSGMEFFPEDGNYIYFIAQWFPRMCVFDDLQGWQNKQFLGAGEFALTFGNYRVKITVPSDHIVGASGWLQNPKDVLSQTQIDRFEKARKTFDQPVFVVTEDEAKKKEKERSKKKKHLGILCRECPRLRLFIFTEVYLGCNGCKERDEYAACTITLSQRRLYALVKRINKGDQKLP
ncbi:MAG: hypothetical protein WDN75_05355 [Bacteroidota bacterium]